MKPDGNAGAIDRAHTLVVFGNAVRSGARHADPRSSTAPLESELP
jgi:hypothetical protein